MALHIDDETPLYLAIRLEIQKRIERGSYSAGESLPSENVLAEEFNTTRLTVRAATDELVKTGLLRRVQGKGTYVAASWFDDVEVRNIGFREIARRNQAEPSVRIISKGMRIAGNYFAELLECDAEDELFCLKRLNCVNGVPVVIENAYIPLKLFPTIDTIDFSVFSLYETYAFLGHKVDKVHEKIDIVTLHAREAGLLNVEDQSAGIYSECISFDESGQPLEFVAAYGRGDRGGYTYTH